MPVPKNPEVITGGYLFLGSFDHLALEFDDRTTLQAHEVIVMLMLQFVPNDAIIKMSLFGKTRLDEEFHGAVDRRVANAGMVHANLLIDLLARRVPLGLQKHVENCIPLPRTLEAFLFQKTGERGLFDFVRHRLRT